MLLAVVVLVVPPVLWTWRMMTDEVRFADAVAPLPAHPLVRRALRRRIGRLEPVLSVMATCRPAKRMWRIATVGAHRRLTRPTHRLALVGAAVVGALSTQAGRWRTAAWAAGTLTVASTVRVIF